MQRPWSSALLLLALLVGFRALGAAFSHELPNFQPLPALFLRSIVFLRGTKAWALPVIAWLLSNPLASALQGYNPFESGGGVIVAFLALLLTGAMALPFRKSPSAALLLGGGLFAAMYCLIPACSAAASGMFGRGFA